MDLGRAHQPLNFQWIGSKDHPIRISAAPSLMACTGGYLAALEEERDSGPAADTGTAVGLLVQLYHLGHSEEEAKLITESSKEVGFEGGYPFPQADMGEAVRAFTLYCEDPRNPRDIVITDSLELSVTTSLPPHPMDPTRSPVWVTGHIDQIRIADDGSLEVWDLKHSRKREDELLRHYAPQQVLYALAASEHYGRKVRWGGLLRTRAYLERRRLPAPPGSGKQYTLADRDPASARAFIRSGYNAQMIDNLVRRFVRRVAWARMGFPIINQGPHCNWCPHKDFHTCYDEWEV